MESDDTLGCLVDKYLTKIPEKELTIYIYVLYMYYVYLCK